MDTAVFIKIIDDHALLVKIYVDTIIFGSTNESLWEEFSTIMQGGFEMYLMGKLNYFCGLKIKQTKNGIFINQSKCYKELLKRFDMDNCKVIATPMSSSAYMDQDESYTLIDITKY